MLKKTAFAVVGFMFILAGIASQAEAQELSYLARKGRPIRVFLGEFANESGQLQILTADFKKRMDAAIVNRRSVKFEVVTNPGESDIQLSGIIKKYRYLKNDPINSYGGAGGLLLDATTSENYAEIEVEFTVIDTGGGKILWKKPISAYVEETMTPEESIPLVYDKVSRNFLWKCFGKGN